MNDGPLSPIPSPSDIDRGLAKPYEICGFSEDHMQGANWLRYASALWRSLSIPDSRIEGRRYWSLNGSYGPLDAAFLAAMCDNQEPKRIIEVGSGHSTALMLDLRDLHVIPDQCSITCIDPDFSRTLPRLFPDDLPELYMLPKTLQDAPNELFEALEAGDILFIDSSHVAKIGSDVNDLFFRVLPLLKPGVLVHIHDVFDNFEYPREWLSAGRYWNEQYMLRAFLMHNDSWKIEAMTARLFNQHPEVIKKQIPIALKTGGGSLWMRRV